MTRKKIFSILIYSYFLLFLFFSSFVFVKNVWAISCSFNGKAGTCKVSCDMLTEDPQTDYLSCTSSYCCIPKTAGTTCVSPPNSCDSTCPEARKGGFAENSWCTNQNHGTTSYCCKPAPITQPTTPTTTGAAGGSTGPLQLQLQVPIGNLSLMIISNSSIGQYIKAVYVFASAVTVALAIIMIMIGGVQWILSGGEPNKIGEAKNTIIKALLGMFIALFAVFMLQTVSPGTVTFQPIVPEGIAGMANPASTELQNITDTINTDAKCKGYKNCPDCSKDTDCKWYTGTGVKECPTTTKEGEYCGIEDIGKILDIHVGMDCLSNEACVAALTQAYCQKAEKQTCQAQKSDGQPCSSSEIVDGNANNVCVNKICTEGKCGGSITYGPGGQKLINGKEVKCTNISNCLPDSYCDASGLCFKKLPKGGACSQSQTKTLASVMCISGSCSCAGALLCPSADSACCSPTNSGECK